MAFNIHNVNRRNELSLIEILFNRQRTPKNEMVKNPNRLKRDTVVISSEAQALSKTQKVKTASSNTRIDQSIDLQACIENAQTANQEAIAAAGDEINYHNYKAYTSEFDVYKAAVTEKYSRLVNEAKTHSNPEDYIRQKYTNQNASWYASDLSDEERRIAYSYELNMLNYGRITSVAMGDSLFRGVTLGASFDVARNEFNRQMVNSQINNILKKNGIELAEGQELSFTVAPYSYEIAVEGVDYETKWKIEKALNIGNNGKNLYYHIKNSATCVDGITSTQIIEDGILKNRLFSETSNMLGLDIRNLSEKNGTYYTDSGEDIIALYNKSVDESNKIPDDYKASEKESFAKLVRQISSRGWSNMADMLLSIGYNESGLIDKYQNYGFGSTSREWLESMLKTSTYCVML